MEISLEMLVAPKASDGWIKHQSLLCSVYDFDQGSVTSNSKYGLNAFGMPTFNKHCFFISERLFNLSSQSRLFVSFHPVEMFPNFCLIFVNASASSLPFKARLKVHLKISDKFLGRNYFIKSNDAFASRLLA